MKAALHDGRLLPQSSHVSSDLQEELYRSDINHLALTERSQVPHSQKNFDGATKGVSSLRGKGEAEILQAQPGQSLKSGGKRPRLKASGSEDPVTEAI